MNILSNPYCQKAVDFLQELPNDIYYMFRPFFYPVENRIEKFVEKTTLSAFQLLVIYTIILLISLSVLKKVSRKLRRFFGLDDPSPLKSKLFRFAIRYIPFIRSKFDREIKKTKDSFLDSMTKHYENYKYTLPENGQSPESLKEQADNWYLRDECFSNTGKSSGNRYVTPSLDRHMQEFCAKFIYHNPLHASEYPGVRQAESEIISMTCNLFSNKEAIGMVTTGGTESILMGILAHRNYYKEKKGITKPNIILPVTAHVAFNKACGYYNIQAIPAPVDPKTCAVNVAEVKRLINKNTICIVGSCPQFPHGTIDDIPSLGKLAKKYDVGLHVDCCLGSFIVPFAKSLGQDIPDFDFRVEGVTSISCDHHKYGLAPKGVSIVMFKTKEIMHSAYFTYSEWPGGLYATSTASGSRCGAPSVGAWFALRTIGRKGYYENAKQVIESIKYLRNEIPKLQELEIVGDPKTCAIAFTFKRQIKASIYAVEVGMGERGWHLAGIQKPPAIHISVTLPFSDNVKLFIKDLREVVKEVISDPERHTKLKKGSVGLYGASEMVPDSVVMGTVLHHVVDSFYTLPSRDKKENGEKINQQDKKLSKKKK